MESSPRFLELAGGLRIAYEEYGNPAGEPVIFCHGWPASRLQGGLMHNAAGELGMRIISPDRPGIALSQFQPGRTLRDWPPLVADLAAGLGIRRYHVLGISGGGPYALATAYGNPGNVKAAAVVSGAIPLAGRDTNEGLFFAYALLLKIHRGNPALLRMLFQIARPLALMPMPNALKPLVIALMDPVDRKALSRDKNGCDICYGSSHEVWKGSVAGAVYDGGLYAEPWGFPPGEIRIPVRLWHGKEDRRFSWKLAESLAEQIPGCVTHFVENEGHISLTLAHMSAILQDLKQAG